MTRSRIVLSRHALRTRSLVPTLLVALLALGGVACGCASSGAAERAAAAGEASGDGVHGSGGVEGTAPADAHVASGGGGGGVAGEDDRAADGAGGVVGSDGPGEIGADADAEQVAAEEAAEPECPIGTPDGHGGCFVSPEDRRTALSDEAVAEHLRGACPDPEYGSFADAWTWVPGSWEQAVHDIDMASEATFTDLLSEFEGTSIIWRVRDAETRTSLAAVKTNTSNNRLEAEVYAWRISEFLGFDELVTPTIYWTPSVPSMRKVRDMLARVTYRDADKEARRQRVIRALDTAMAGGTPFEAVVKPWLTGFIPSVTMGRRENMAEHRVMQFLRVGGPQPGTENIRLTTISRLNTPHGTHRADFEEWRLATDLSNLLLMDAIMGQNDRFAGGNLHMRSEAWHREEVGTARNLPIFAYGPSRLLALDNGAALRGTHGSGLNDLQGRNLAGTRVERFDRDVVERLRGLARRTTGRYCDTEPFADEREAAWLYLGLDGAWADRAENFMLQTLDYIDQLEARHGDRIWLRPRRPESDGEEPAVAPSGEAVAE